MGACGCCECMMSCAGCIWGSSIELEQKKRKKPQKTKKGGKFTRASAKMATFWGTNFGASTCGTCIHTRANTGKYSWRIIYVLVSCQGVFVRNNFKVANSDILSLTEAPLPDATPTPPNGPEMDRKRSRNRPETQPNGAKRTRTEPKWTEIKPSRVGRPEGGFVGWGGVRL